MGAVDSIIVLRSTCANGGRENNECGSGVEPKVGERNGLKEERVND